LPTRLSLPGRHHEHDATRQPLAHWLKAYSPNVGEVEVFSDIIAPLPSELFSETNDNSVAMPLTHGTAPIFAAGDAVAMEEYMARGIYRRS
jgi:hypothetical protein